MIIPSIDLMNGKAVQLRGGNPDDKILDLGDPLALVDRFQVAGRIVVVDLDAAMGLGSNTDTIKAIIDYAKCPVIVGGGIRTTEKAEFWLNSGAEKIVIGTAAGPEFLKNLPKDRVIVALDSENGVVMTHGWKKSSGKKIEDVILALEDYVSNFLCTFIEIEGRLTGIPFDRVIKLQKLLKPETHLIIAGGVKSVQDIKILSALNTDAQVGLALHTGDVNLGEAVASCLETNDENLYPTIVTDEDGVALGLAYSSKETLIEAVNSRRGIYFSRKRGRWPKGETSGSHQDLIRVELDCDNDAIKFVVHQHGTGFCHKGTCSCFGDYNVGIRQWAKPILNPRPGGYTEGLTQKHNYRKLVIKFFEEANEFMDAKNKTHIVEEFVDLLYFMVVKLSVYGITWNDVMTVIRRRNAWHTHRHGDVKSE